MQLHKAEHAHPEKPFFPQGQKTKQAAEVVRATL